MPEDEQRRAQICRADVPSSARIGRRMTGYGQSEDVRRALDAKFDTHVVKPAESSALNAALRMIGSKPSMLLLCGARSVEMIRKR